MPALAIAFPASRLFLCSFVSFLPPSLLLFVVFFYYYFHPLACSTYAAFPKTKISLTHENLQTVKIKTEICLCLISRLSCSFLWSIISWKRLEKCELKMKKRFKRRKFEVIERKLKKVGEKSIFWWILIIFEDMEKLKLKL